MNPMIVRICILTALMISAASAAPDRLFYRITANTNTTITSWTPDGTLTWICADTNGSYTIEATSDLGNSSTCFWGTVAYGVNTGLVMACTAPKPDTIFPVSSPMALIPAGDFLMGDIYHTPPSLPDEDPEGPPHSVYTSAFYLDTTEVSMGLWDDVVNWATNHGYSFSGNATGWDTNYPVSYLTWYDCVKWCNARSEKEGYTPVYFTDESQTNIYRAGELDLVSSNVNWSGRGYRLPTEAEWEKAARGGLYQNYFPWPSPGPTNYLVYISASNANYLDSGGLTTPCATYSPNDYGLLDMSGNVSEWCWDYHDYYRYFTTDHDIDPTGPPQTASLQRVFRGGSYVSDANSLRCSSRTSAWTPEVPSAWIGFRCARSCR